MPGKGKYTVLKMNARLARLFPGNPATITPPFLKDNGTPMTPQEALEELVAKGNAILRAEASEDPQGLGQKEGFIYTGDPSWPGDGGRVDVTYRNREGLITPPNGQLTPDKPGDPMNAFVPDISSPGPGPSGESASELGTLRAEGTDKTLEGNPKFTPEEYMRARGRDLNPSPGTRRTPAGTGSSVYSSNTLGPSNKFDTSKSEQYPE
jgi:hypothetical protein